MWKKLIFYFLLFFCFSVSKKWYGDAKEVFINPKDRFNFVISTVQMLKNYPKKNSTAEILIWYNASFTLHESITRPIS